ncbi:hypothetical protein BDK51DRAFT_40434 [Blyttiomyces helicus]|uniref:PH domain-containing protein n=1 Tax=Blyttiomyces helicus TaxID=388810 RepID=A0A4P9WA85_9FUNG|nr:hypothetical protein BDK51DRAFT_40434 [Blyttiomyces helicus]|eukprot:RKO87760.1 hypothetical protein BDK51DRAFT_40434 [Blyttiomyces helicus]
MRVFPSTFSSIPSCLALYRSCTAGTPLLQSIFWTCFSTGRSVPHNVIFQNKRSGLYPGLGVPFHAGTQSRLRSPKAPSRSRRRGPQQPVSTVDNRWVAPFRDSALGATVPQADWNSDLKPIQSSPPATPFLATIRQLAPLVNPVNLKTSSRPSSNSTASPPLPSSAQLAHSPSPDPINVLLRRKARVHLGQGRRLPLVDMVEEIVVAEGADLDVSPQREVESVQRTDLKPYCFEVVTLDKSFFISCKSDEELYSWMDEIY